MRDPSSLTAHSGTAKPCCSIMVTSTPIWGFRGNNEAENYAELVEILVKNYDKMGLKMSLKVHILDAHLDKFKEKIGTYSEEKG
ncbi:hypothetical protein J437_LFUL017975 [Ladona fulva]|uniref:Uncharacterized protein n=1 Tax=Ladona fulva TaxID=123851 RepID=A0A8K0KQ67_LADFU|nr:hypothetical protein J437_LFUL017975 [Ladona fulva]